MTSTTRLGVVVTCTLLWLTTVVVRGPFIGGKTNLDASWLVGLAASHGVAAPGGIIHYLVF